MPAIFGGYLVLAVTSFGGAIFYWRRLAVQVGTERLEEEPLGGESDYTARQTNRRGVESTELETSSDEDDTTPVPIPAPCSGQTDNYTLISSRTPRQQLRSRIFLTLMLFFSFFTARNIFTLSTARDFLAGLGDDEKNNMYLTIFTLLTPASVAALPLVDFVVHRYGFAGGLHAVNFLSIVHGLIQILSTNLNVQVLGFVAFTLSRCFTNCVCFSLMASFLSPNVTGKGAGIYSCAVGVCLIVNIPLSNQGVSDSGFFVPNLLYTVLIAPCIIGAWLIGKWEKRDEAAAKEAGASNLTSPV